MPVLTPRETLEAAELLDVPEDTEPTEVSQEEVLEGLYESVSLLINILGDLSSRTEFLQKADSILESEDRLDLRIASMETVRMDLYKIFGTVYNSKVAEDDWVAGTAVEG